MWTRRHASEWKPRRASVASCHHHQQQQQQQQPQLQQQAAQQHSIEQQQLLVQPLHNYEPNNRSIYQLNDKSSDSIKELLLLKCRKRPRQHQFEDDPVAAALAVATSCATTPLCQCSAAASLDKLAKLTGCCAPPSAQLAAAAAAANIREKSSEKATSLRHPEAAASTVAHDAREKQRAQASLDRDDANKIETNLGCELDETDVRLSPTMASNCGSPVGSLTLLGGGCADRWSTGVLPATCAEEEDNIEAACKCRSRRCSCGLDEGKCDSENDGQHDGRANGSVSIECCCQSGLEDLIVEFWLDDHPEFVRDYFVRKASRQLIDEWLLAHARVSNTNVNSQSDLRSASSMSRPVSQSSLNVVPRGVSWRSSAHPSAETSLTTSNNNNNNTAATADEPNCTSAPNLLAARTVRSDSQSGAIGGASFLNRSGAMTPVRKISATDFESRTGSALLRPMLSTTPDGRLTFLVQPASALDEQTRDERRVGAAAAAAANAEHHQSKRKSSLANPVAPSLEINKPAGLATGADGAEIFNENNNNSRGKSLPANQVLGEPADAAECQHQTVVGRPIGVTTERHLDHDETAAVCCDARGPAEANDDTRLSGEKKLIFELVKNICDDLDIRTLLHKILKNIAVLINADRSSLFLVCGNAGDANRHLVSQLFNVDQDSAELAAEPDDCIVIPWGTGLVGYVAESGESVNIADCYQDPRFSDAIDQRTGYVTKHMLCAPVFDKHGDIVGVAQVINKRDGQPFSLSDEIKFKRYLQFCGIGLRNAQSYEHCQLENRRNQVLLDLARMVFEEQSSIEQVVYRIMLHTQSLLDCERCQVLLIDNGNDDIENLLRDNLQLPNWCPTASGVASGGGGGGSSSMALTSDQSTSPPPPPVVESAQQQKQQPMHAYHGKARNLGWRPQCRKAEALGRPTGETGECATQRHAIGTCQGTNVDADHEPLRQDHQLELARASAPEKPSSKLFSLIFDLDCDGANDPVVYSSKDDQHQKLAAAAAAALPHKKAGRNFPINIGITGYVAMTGETLNIEDAHSHERFDPSVDLGSGFRHRSILCMPIRNGRRQIIGVSQLINKKNGRPFNKNDEDLFEAFSIFCGLGIHQTLMYERVLKIMAKQRVTFEVLSYHATAPLDEAKRLHQEQIPSCFALNLGSLKFNDFSLDDQYMLKSCLRFFLDLDLIRRFQIDQLVFCRWILSVQKNYRKVTYHPIVGGNGLTASPVRYHNWRHAFNVGQMMFAILVNTQICYALGELETLALLIACLCHDLDHRGTNNSFQIKSASPLAELYSTSTMEHHHFDQCVMILNSQGNQILANLTPEEYSQVIVLLEEAILATDLANYFQRRDLFFQLVNSDNLNWRTKHEHRSLLRCMLMTACDVAAITKPWPVQKVVADLVMSEFYQQGDIERNELNLEPIDLMNRDKVNELPAMQLGFIDSICAPIYTAFARLFPRELGPLLDGCLANRELWHQMANNNSKPDISKLDYLAESIQNQVDAQTSLPLNCLSKSEAHINRHNQGAGSQPRDNMLKDIDRLCMFEASDIVDYKQKVDEVKHTMHRNPKALLKSVTKRKSV